MSGARTRPAFLLPALLLLAAAVLACATPDARADEFVSLPTRPGVVQNFALVAPERVRAVAVLFSGGAGLLSISEADGKAVIANGGNFLVRTRETFARQGIAVAVVDCPSDRNKGITDGFRVSEEHATDIGVVADYLRKRFGLKPWLIGTSMGTISAAATGSALGDAAAGVVLTSSITRTGRNLSNTVLSSGLGKIRVPVLITAHANDSCDKTPPAGAALIRDGLAQSTRAQVQLFRGGLPARSGVCEAFSEHGYYGIEDEVVSAIAAFVLQGQGEN